MRFYITLILFITVFACAASSRVSGWAGDLAYDARVTFVLTFGGAADYEALVDDTQRMLAEQSGCLDVYEADKRYRALVVGALAEVARRRVTLSERDVFRLKDECARRAFESGPCVTKTQVGREPWE